MDAPGDPADTPFQCSDVSSDQQDTHKAPEKTLFQSSPFFFNLPTPFEMDAHTLFQCPSGLFQSSDIQKVSSTSLFLSSETLKAG